MAYTPMRSIKELLEGILEVLQHVRVLGAIRGGNADIRSTITGGSISTVTTVTTVTTMTNQSQIGGNLADPQIPALMNMKATLGNINNISITP